MELPKQLAATIESRLDVGFIRSREDYPDGVSASVIKHERLLLALPDDHRLAEAVEVEAFEVEALSSGSSTWFWPIAPGRVPRPCRPLSRPPKDCGPEREGRLRGRLERFGKGPAIVGS